MAGRSSPARSRLSRRLVIETALALVDRDGAGALSMRRIAEELDVTAMSLYGHVRGREELLDGFVELLLERLAPVATDGDSPTDTLRRFAAGVRATGLAHPAAWALIGMRPLRVQPVMTPIEGALAALRSLGLPDEDVVSAYRTITTYVRGFTLAEISGFSLADGAPGPDGHLAINELAPALRDADPGATFAFGLDAILDGLALRGRASGPATQGA